MRTALTIAGSDSSGGAGIQADIKTMTMNGVFAMSAITALTAQNTTGVTGILNSTPEFLAQQLDAVFTDIYPDAVKIGMVSSQELIRVIAQKLRQYGAKHIVVDPVMVATSGAALLEPDAVTALETELLPLAEVITPNIPEAEILCGHSIKTAADMENAAKEISQKFGCNVLCKGGHNLNDANDLLLDDKEQQIVMITGPNMSGKSALLRQTALIILMAQMGSFVPAKSAHIGVVDKIFTRVGASDNISQGESTFMVEMLESASILNNISDRSIVLLDEIGRGTSTYDGISIAWAMVEYLHNHPTAHAKTLFATHYHELNEMEQMCPRVKNYHVSVKEMGNQIVFLRKLERGGTEHSFGIHVARMAGMPMSVVSRADEILRNLELVYGNNEIVPSRSLKSRGKKPSPSVREAAEAGAPQNMQLSMFQLDDPVLVQIRDQIKGLDIDSLTPIEALNKLNEIKKITGI